MKERGDLFCFNRTTRGYSWNKGVVKLKRAISSHYFGFKMLVNYINFDILPTFCPSIQTNIRQKWLFSANAKRRLNGEIDNLPDR